MLAAISGIASAIRALFELWKYWRQWKLEQEKIEAITRQQELEKAVDQSKTATTEKEIWDAQDSIVSKRPVSK
jgi:hypothetical protein